MGRQEEQIAHASNIITPAIARKTARQRLIRTRFAIYEFATDRRGTYTDEEHPLTLRQDNDEFDKLSALRSSLESQSRGGGCGGGGGIRIRFDFLQSTDLQCASLSDQK